MSENNEFVLKSGAVLLVTVSEFKFAKKFQNEIYKSVQALNLGGMEMLALAMTVASNESVEAAFFKCAERAVYKADGTDQTAQKVSPALFDDLTYGEKARNDYQEIFSKIAEVNVRPFTSALFSVLGAILPGKSLTDLPTSK